MNAAPPASATTSPSGGTPSGGVRGRGPKGRWGIRGDAGRWGSPRSSEAESGGGKGRRGRGNQSLTRIPPRTVQRPRTPSKRDQRRQITPAGHLRGHRGNSLDSHSPPLGHRHQPQMPRRRLHLSGPPQNPHHRHPDGVQRLPQQPLVPVRGHLVQDHAPDPHLRVPAHEPVHQRRHRPSLRRRVDHQHHRRPQQLRDLRGRRQLPLPRRPRRTAPSRPRRRQCHTPARRARTTGPPARPRTDTRRGSAPTRPVASAWYPGSM
ncbi:hypothetical protein SALBM217S_02267 [Streptomyces griseoloalbus]